MDEKLTETQLFILEHGIDDEIAKCITNDDLNEFEFILKDNVE